MVRILSDDALTQRDVERVLSERQWFPLYEKYGPFDRDLIYCLPIERQYPLDEAREAEID